ncbi:hypothetical protein QBC34DRAFT_130614 [Podospora aff. communis PSN243]|uniref:Uncharacterized protein n=1 Tax=Podospora aff. communis PSN243 TaxID=3040156 RepID=A0AAV9GGE6_9PEZI|nr:hypothetical protein QBC34DRAFT_130614 [Podospora aff. communis PSN243]
MNDERPRYTPGLVLLLARDYQGLAPANLLLSTSTSQIGKLKIWYDSAPFALMFNILQFRRRNRIPGWKDVGMWSSREDPCPENQTNNKTSPGVYPIAAMRIRQDRLLEAETIQPTGGQWQSPRLAIQKENAQTVYPPPSLASERHGMQRLAGAQQRSGASRACASFDAVTSWLASSPCRMGSRRPAVISRRLALLSAGCK